jgi:hypothetical protein
MGRAGNVWDNAAMESFFSSMKIERTERKIYRTHDQAKADVFDYIERFRGCSCSAGCHALRPCIGASAYVRSDCSGSGQPAGHRRAWALHDDGRWERCC